MQNNVHAENQFKHEIKTSRLEEYHHPMSKWIHIAYSSPKPRSSRMYQQLITNFNKITKEENKKPSKRVVEKEVPIQVAWEKHVHLLSWQRFRNFDSLQERSNNYLSNILKFSLTLEYSEFEDSRTFLTNQDVPHEVF